MLSPGAAERHLPPAVAVLRRAGQAGPGLRHGALGLGHRTLSW